ncbi:MAG TPA: hypothetical protein VJA66_13270, partial [Thermoanaerobaculia bacterium]
VCVGVEVGGKVREGSGVNVAAAVRVAVKVAVGRDVDVGVGVCVARRTITTAIRSGEVAEFELSDFAAGAVGD